MFQEDTMEECVRIPSGSLSLEGVLAYPQEQEPKRAILLLAPHPHMGGNLDNNVIRHLARRAAEDGAISLRFNYRGVGNSSIELPEGLSCYDYFAEMEAKHAYEPLLEDAVAALHWLSGCANSIPNGPIIGYSLGAVLAGTIAREHPVDALVGISPPNRRLSMACFEENRAHKVFLGGDRDFAFDKAQFEPEMRRFQGCNEFIFIPGCDHFFRGQEDSLYTQIRPYLFGETEEVVCSLPS